MSFSKSKSLHSNLKTNSKKKLLKEDVDKESLNYLINQARNYSASLTDRMIILKMTKWLQEYLPLSNDEIRKILILAFRNYHGKNSVPLQKLALLEPDEREAVFRMLKDTIQPLFEQVLLPNIALAREILNEAINDFLARYLY